MENKQLNNLPENWELDHNINDLEYWFTNNKLDIDLQLVKTNTVDDYELWELTFMVWGIDGGGWTKQYRKLKNALSGALNTMKEFN